MHKMGLFEFDTYYPEGGFEDFIMGFDGYHEVEDWLNKKDYISCMGNLQIVDFSNYKYKTIYIGNDDEDKDKIIDMIVEAILELESIR